MLRSWFAALATSVAVALSGGAYATTTITPVQTASVSSGGLFHFPMPGGSSGAFLTVDHVGGWHNYGLIQFDLGAFPDPVSQATLQVFHNFNQANATFGVFANTSAWNQYTTSYVTRPSFVHEAAATQLITDRGGVYESFDITGLVNAWITGRTTNYGVSFMRTDDPNPYLYFAASGPHRPLLTLTPAARVPEPAAWTLLLLGVAAIGAGLRRGRRHASA